MPLDDPWLSERMHEYARIRRAETEMHPAVRDAVAEYLTQARAALLGDTASFADSEDDEPDPRRLPDENVWWRAVTRHIAPAARRIWRASFGRLTGRQPADDDQRQTDDTLSRVGAFHAVVADRLRRALHLGRQRGETPAQLRARVAALMTLENWDGQVMTMTRTATMTALNAGAYAGAHDEQERTGQPWEKRWQSTHDQRVRHTHHDADGQIRPLHQPFRVGESELQFPGDPKGAPGEVINCRCAARYAPAADPVLTAASTPQEEPHMAPTATATAPGAGTVTVSPDGRWRGALGFIDQWSADNRMLAAPADGVRVRPLPLPLAIQSTLADGHEGGKVGLGVIDRVWVEGDTIMGEGRFDMEDPVAADIARKVGLGFLRFVSLDVDDATLKHVCVGDDGAVIEKCTPRQPSDIGRLYTDWRVMGATLVAHPAFPNAFITLADTTGTPLTAAAFADAIGYDPEWGCVRPDGDGWQPADCDAPGARPANPAGDGPYEPPADQDTQAPPDAEDELEPEEDTPATPEAPLDEEAAPTDQELPDDTVTDDGNGCVAPDPEQDGAWVPADCDTEGAVPANAAGDAPADDVTDAANTAAQLGQGGTDDRLANEHHDTLTTQPPADCTTCTPVTVTAAAADTAAPGWTPPAEWFQPPAAHQAHPIRVDPETGRVSGYLAAWGTCHVGYKDRCVTPPRSATDYSYFNIRPVPTSNGTVHCGLLTMDTGHASLSASPTAALAHYDNTGTQAAVVRVGEDNHGIWAVGAVLPFITPEQRLRLSLASFSGDWRSIRGSMELIAALAVNTPGFPLAAARTGTDNHTYALVAAGALPPADPAATEDDGMLTADLTTSGPLVDPAAIAAEVMNRLETREALRARFAALDAHLKQFRADATRRAERDTKRRIELARNRVVRVQKPRATEPPMELAGLGTLPRPSNQDIALAKNWVDQQGGLPPYIKRIADHLKAKGMDTSRAIATAVNVAKKMCATGDTNWPGVQQVNAKSKGEACAAVARWNAMKAAAKAS